MFRQAPGRTHSAELERDCIPLNPAFLPLARVGQHCWFTGHSLSALLLQAAVTKCHLTLKHRQTTSPPAAWHTTPAGCPQSPIPPAPAISRCSTVLRASIHMISGCICHSRHLHLDFEHSLLLHSQPSPSCVCAGSLQTDPTRDRQSRDPAAHKKKYLAAERDLQCSEWLTDKYYRERSPSPG